MDTNPTRDRLLARRLRLRQLAARLDVELAQVDAALAKIAAETAPAPQAAGGRPRHDVECGTEAGYQRHRLDGPWPLPDDDPCGCKEAHRQHYHHAIGMGMLPPPMHAVKAVLA